MIKIDKNPKYQLGQSFTLIGMGTICENVQIISRMAVVDIDNTNRVTFQYNLKHMVNVSNPWSWNSVSEEELTEWIKSSELELKGRRVTY